jgi:radical SAM protein with 4Fe4S-binding SPASM domain
MTQTIPYIKEGLLLGQRSGINVSVEAIPYCLLGEKLKTCIIEQYLPSIDIREANRKIINFENVRRNQAKVKFRQCETCRYFSICEGVWKEYPERLGNDEFIPVTMNEYASVRY